METKVSIVNHTKYCLRFWLHLAKNLTAHDACSENLNRLSDRKCIVLNFSNFEFFINFAAAAFLRDCFDIKSLNYFIYYGKIIISVAVNMFIINKR